MTPLIRALREELESMVHQPWPTYTVPGLWVGNTEPVTFASPPAYFLHQFQSIDRNERFRRHRPWSVSKALVYNGMVRHITSYNHGSGVVESGWRTTGTFLKLAALLPYLLRLDIDTLLLMPITEIGNVGKKGTLGSPYAVSNPWRIDSNLAESVIGLSVEDQARIFIESCHALGIRVVIESVLRTASIDSSLVNTHPEWFYWVDEAKVRSIPNGFGSPVFSSTDLSVIKEKVANNDLTDLPEPPSDYQELFTPPPLRIEHDDRGWRGIAPKQKVVRIPGAFADWPPDDQQPAWSDVTYLRLHDHPHYRYMAYNTVRAYESNLDVEEYRSQPLWNTLSSIIPHFIRMLNVDGAMIDMGHALPQELRVQILRDAKALRPDFVLFEENFNNDASVAEQGYDAVIGQLPLVAHTPQSLSDYIATLASHAADVRYFATPESHNTPRSITQWGSTEAVAAVWTIIRVLPGAVGFVHAGIELAESRPVNTGLGFTKQQAELYSPETLALFSDVPLPWDNESAIVHAIIRTSRYLHGTSFWEHASDSDTLIVLDMPESCIAFLRIPTNSRQGLLCVANLTDHRIRTRVVIPPDSGVMFLSPNSSVHRAGANIDVELEPWQVELVFTLH